MITLKQRGGGREGGGKKNQCHSVIAYYGVILCIDIDNTHVYICCD